MIIKKWVTTHERRYSPIEIGDHERNAGQTLVFAAVEMLYTHAFHSVHMYGNYTPKYTYTNMFGCRWMQSNEMCEQLLVYNPAATLLNSNLFPFFSSVVPAALFSSTFLSASTSSPVNRLKSHG